MMKALQIASTDGPQAAVLTSVDEPQGAHPWAHGERLLVEVHSAAVNFPDLLQTRGMYQHAAPAPYVVGGEYSGIVIEADPTSRFSIGDRVAGLSIFGSIAEQVLAIPSYTIKIPDSMTFNQGAAFYLNYLTAWFTLHRAQFTDGESVLVHGASGGVGSAVLDLLRNRTDKSLAVVSSERKAHAATQCGADQVFYIQDDWGPQVREFTGDTGVNIVVDPVGGDRFTESLRCLDVGGRLMVVGFAEGRIPEVKVNRLLLRDLSVMGVAVNPWVERYPEFGSLVVKELEMLASTGHIQPLVGDVLDFDQAPKALSIIERREALGKVVIEVRSENGRGTKGEKKA